MWLELQIQCQKSGMHHYQSLSQHYRAIYTVNHNRDYFLKVADMNPNFTN